MTIDTRERVSRSVVAALLAVVAGIPIYTVIHAGGWPRNHENTRYFLLMFEFRQTFLAGFWYPRWLAEMYGGYGYPTFVFYQPGFFFWTLPWALLLSDTSRALIASCYTLTFLGGFGAYRLARFFAPRSVALFCAWLFLATPYLFVNFMVRGDLSEWAAMLLTPWPLVFLLRFASARASGSHGVPQALASGLSLAAVIVSHPATAVGYLPTFSVLAIIVAFTHVTSTRARALVVAAPIVLGLALSLPYWLPLLTMSRYVNLEKAVGGGFNAYRHVVHPWQFLDTKWGIGFSAPDNEPDEISFQLGIVHFALAVVGVVAGRRRPFVVTSFGLYAALLVIMSTLGMPLWKYVSVLRQLQYPWRFLSVTAVLQVVVAAGTAPLWARLPERVRWTALAMACVAIYAVHAQQFQSHVVAFDVEKNEKKFLETRFDELHSLALVNEFLPRTSKTPPPVNTSGPGLFEVEGRGSVTLDEAARREHPKAQVRLSANSALVINQLYLPGWVVLIDGQPVGRKRLENYLMDDGRMRIAVSSDAEHTVEAYYGGPPGGTLRTIAIVMLVITICGALVLL